MYVVYSCIVCVSTVHLFTLIIKMVDNNITLFYPTSLAYKTTLYLMYFIWMMIKKMMKYKLLLSRPTWMMKNWFIIYRLINVMLWC